MMVAMVVGGDAVACVGVVFMPVLFGDGVGSGGGRACWWWFVWVLVLV